jgi:hypothetical protein
MKEHPILFSQEMVTALLEGRKSQTRRVVKPQPDLSVLKDCHTPVEFRRCPILGPTHKPAEWGLYTKTSKCGDVPIYGYDCPYGQVGSKLWVRETWCDTWPFDGHKCEEGPCYRATDEGDCGAAITGQKWKPSIFMPRWASRITLEITDIRVQRLWEISEDDAIAEGVLSEEGIKDWNEHPLSFATKTSPKDEYARLWDKINGKKYPWYSNPWVWVIEFKRV